MDFRILGPLQVFEGEMQLPLGKPRERAVLAALLLHANEALSRDRLIDLVWGESPPRTVDAAVYNCISRLRRALGTERLAGDGSGYRLVVNEGELDRDRFESLVARGQAAFAEGAAERAAELLAEALATWRGDPLDDVRYEPFAQTEIRRLAELHLTALEARIEADLARGRHGALVAELEGLVHAHPWRERFHAQLMLALYRCGRQADALDAYRDARRALGETLGLEPSARLQDLERKILRQDRGLDLIATVAPAGLPIPPTRLIGRERELSELRDLLSDDEVRLLTLVGVGGVGKTRLAIELAATTRRHIAFVDLSSLTAPEQTLAAVAHGLGVRETGGESLMDASARRVRALEHCLLVTDNFERVVEAGPDVAALLASCPQLRVLATSREPLHVAAERVYVVEPLPEDGAVTLFVERGRRLRPSLTADDEVARLCRRLDGLALAVELAAARVNVLTPRQILERLDRRLELLSSGPRDVPARHRTLRAAIEWSYDCLANGERRLFARLAAFSESFSLEAAEAVCNADVDTLASLVDKSLIHRRDDRFALLDTVREYATEVLEASGDAYELRRVHAEHYLGLIDRDDMRTAPPHVTAVIASEYGNLRASLAWTIDAAPELALRLAAALSPFWNEHGMFAEGRQWLDRALQRTPDEPSFARASALTGASWLAHLTGDHDRTKELAERAVMAGRAIDNPRIVVQALNHLGSSAQLDDGTYEHARRFFEEAAVVARAHGDELGLGSALTNLGVVASSSGDWDEALGLFSDALLVLPTNALLLLNLALAELETGHEAATVAPRYEYVFRRASDRGDPLIVACALLGLGLAVARAGFCDQAVRVLGAASAQREALDYELELPERLVYAEIVDDLHARLGQDAFGDAWADGRMLEAEEAFALGLEAIHAPASARRRSR